jgi:hypothetical protein
MSQAAHKLARAVDPRRTEVIGVRMNDSCTARRALLRHLERSAAPLPWQTDPFDHLGDYIAGSLDPNAIAGPNVFALYLSLIV